MTKQLKLNRDFTGLVISKFVFDYEGIIDGDKFDVQVYVEIKNRKVNITKIDCIDCELTQLDKDFIQNDLLDNIKQGNLNLPETIYYDCSDTNLVSDKGYLTDFVGGDWYPHEIKI